MNKGKSSEDRTSGGAAKPKSSTAGTSGDAAKTEQPSQQINIQMIQNVLLIWLDSNIDDNSADCRNTITQLQRAVNTVKTFTDGDQCIAFIDTMGDEKACMLIPGFLGQLIVPRVHDMSQLDSIFIFCTNKEIHQKWAKEWPKIKGVFTEIAPICEALKQTARQCEQNSISISFMAPSSDHNSKKNLDQLDCSFMYIQILKEILLTITFEKKHFTEFINYCRGVFAENQGELETVKQLERKYGDETPIWWYTYECFLYPMLNRALRLMDVDIIIKLGFFIDDLHRHIEQLHKEQFGGQQIGQTFTVYRGQGMSETEFKQMNKTKGGLMAFNNFLFTSKKCEVSLEFANTAAINPDLVGILFVMTIDPAQSTTPFASIVNVSYYKEKEDEVLFAMHTVFRINHIRPMSENERLFQVELTLTSDNDKDLRRLTDRIREETEESSGWDQLGELLLKMGQFEKAQQVYEILLEQTTKEIDKARIYHQLGKVKRFQAEYKESIIFNEKALAIRQQSLPPTHPDLAKSYNSIGMVYDSMGEYSKALSYYEKDLKVSKQSLPPTHPHLAKSYNNIGNLYYSMCEYSEALSYYEKDLKVSKQSLPPNHPHLAKSYNNIGIVYYCMGEYSEALSYYEKALAIRQQSLPPNHPDLATSYYNIGLVYDSMGEYSKALSSHEKALEIRQQALPVNHPDLASSCNNIGLVYDSMGEYSKALSSYEKALAIRQQSLPPNHPRLAGSLNNIGVVYYSMGEYSKALSYYEKALAIRQESLPSSHPDLAMSYNNIGLVYENIGNYSKARSLYERAVDIVQQSSPPDLPDLQMCERNIDIVKKKL